jgi:predicted  nucleic acid-binding Zn-ribbon protein
MVSNLHVAVGALEGKADRLESKLDLRLDAPVSSRASQTTADAILAHVDALADNIIPAARALETKADRLEAKADALQNQFDAFDADVRASLAVFGDLFAALEGKADRLEAKADAHQNQFNAFDVDVRGELAIHRAALNALEAKADRLEGKADRLEGKADALAADLTAQTDELDTAAARLETKADALAADLDAETGQIDVAVARLEVKSDGLQALLEDVSDNVGDPDPINIEIVQLRKHRQYVFQTTVDGALANSSLVRVLGVVEDRRGNLSVVDITSRVTATALSDGLLHVKISGRERDEPHTKIYVFQFRHVDGNGVTHLGTTMFHYNFFKNEGD